MFYHDKLSNLQIANIFCSSVYFIINEMYFSYLAKVCVRYASKKSSTSTRNKGGHPRPKHRGWKVQDGTDVKVGRLLVTQRTTRFHSGLNVGINYCTFNY